MKCEMSRILVQKKARLNRDRVTMDDVMKDTNCQCDYVN